MIRAYLRAAKRACSCRRHPRGAQVSENRAQGEIKKTNHANLALGACAHHFAGSKNKCCSFGVSAGKNLSSKQLETKIKKMKQQRGELDLSIHLIRMITAAKRFGLYSALRADVAIFLSSNFTPKVTVATMFLSKTNNQTAVNTVFNQQSKKIYVQIVCCEEDCFQSKRNSYCSSGLIPEVPSA